MVQELPAVSLNLYQVWVDTGKRKQTDPGAAKFLSILHTSFFMRFSVHIYLFWSKILLKIFSEVPFS